MSSFVIPPGGTSSPEPTVRIEGGAPVPKPAGGTAKDQGETSPIDFELPDNFKKNIRPGMFISKVIDEFGASPLEAEKGWSLGNLKSVKVFQKDEAHKPDESIDVIAYQKGDKTYAKIPVTYEIELSREITDDNGVKTTETKKLRVAQDWFTSAQLPKHFGGKEEARYSAEIARVYNYIQRHVSGVGLLLAHHKEHAYSMSMFSRSVLTIPRFEAKKMDILFGRFIKQIPIQKRPAFPGYAQALSTPLGFGVLLKKKLPEIHIIGCEHADDESMRSLGPRQKAIYAFQRGQPLDPEEISAISNDLNELIAENEQDLEGLSSQDSFDPTIALERYTGVNEIQKRLWKESLDAMETDKRKEDFVVYCKKKYMPIFESLSQTIDTLEKASKAMGGRDRWKDIETMRTNLKSMKKELEDLFESLKKPSQPQSPEPQEAQTDAPSTSGTAGKPLDAPSTSGTAGEPPTSSVSIETRTSKIHEVASQATGGVPVNIPGTEGDPKVPSDSPPSSPPSDREAAWINERPENPHQWVRGVIPPNREAPPNS